MKKLASAFVAATLLPATALAQGYLGASFGASDYDLDCAGLASCDTSDTAYKLYGGYRLGSGLSAELGYISFGTARGSGAGIRGDVKAAGPMLGLAWAVPMSGPWGLDLRIGFANLKTTVSGTAPGIGSLSDSDTAAKLYIGIGLGYEIAKNLRLELGADFSDAEYGGDEAGVSAIGLGLRLAF